MQRYIFWGVIILIFLIIGLVIDQIFYRIIRLFLEKHTANIVRFAAFCTTVLVISVTIICGHYYTRLQVKVNNVVLESKRVPEAFNGFKIAQISDFHLDSFDQEKEIGFVESIIDQILAQNPDIICFTGDLVSMRSAQALPYRSILKKLSSAGIPVYSVMGNHDYADYVWRFDESRKQIDRDSLRLIQREAGWNVLDNDCEWIRRGCDSILVAGVENIGEPPFSVYGDLSAALDKGKPTDKDFVVLLSHNPTHWRNEVIPNTSIDLTLSGHTHAMQFSIGPWSPSKIKYPEYSGLYREGNQFLYVNTGLGGVGPRIRVGVKPEISIIKLVCK